MPKFPLVASIPLLESIPMPAEISVPTPVTTAYWKAATVVETVPVPNRALIPPFANINPPVLMTTNVTAAATNAVLIALAIYPEDLCSIFFAHNSYTII